MDTPGGNGQVEKLGWRGRQHHIYHPCWFHEVPEAVSCRSPQHTTRSQSTWRLCHTLQLTNWSHHLSLTAPSHPSKAHVYSSFHRFGNRFRGWITHPRSQSRNLSLKFHIQWPCLQTHTVLSLRQPRLECSKEAETRVCSCTGTLMGRGGSLQKGGPDGGIMNYTIAIFFSTSHSILEDSPRCSGFLRAPGLWWEHLEPLTSHLMFVCLCAKSLQSLLTLLWPLVLHPSGTSVHKIPQARILEWVDIPSSRGSSWPRDRTCISCIDWRFLHH